MKESHRMIQRLLVVGGILLGLGACADGEPESEVLPPNVVLIVMDTVRADHVSSYGYARSTTPNVDALAQVGVRYSQCRATGPWTLPSHASMFTGQFPFQHRADSLISEQGQWRELPLKGEHTTLAEALSTAGYRTAGFVANVAYLREEFQLNQGFDEYVVKSEPGLVKNQEAFDFVDGGSGPFFLFLNYMDAHRPYNNTRLAEDRMGEFECDGPLPSARLLDKMYDVVMRAGREAPPELVASLTRCYDLGIANGDLAVGEVIDGLRSRGQLENTLLIVTSDHGEFLGEHGLVEHSKDIYEEVLHVPLVCKFPDSQTSKSELGKVDDQLISLADIPRLVAGVMPADIQEEFGKIFPLQRTREFTMAEISISRERDMRASYGARFRRQRQVYYNAGHKLILSSDGHHELYNLDADPGEQHNIHSEAKDLARDLRDRMLYYIETHPAPYTAADAPTMNAEALRALERLGYAGGNEEPK